MLCAICQQEICEDEARCALFWRLDLFWFKDFGSDDDDEESPFERYEQEYDF
jgi:hypothetical protein